MQIVTSAVRRLSPSRSRHSVSLDCHGSVHNEDSVEGLAPDGSCLPRRVSRRRGASVNSEEAVCAIRPLPL